MMNENWIAVAEKLPPKGKVVMTKIDDKDGVRNVQELYYSSNLWWFPSGSMYVYYTPTHWAE